MITPKRNHVFPWSNPLRGIETRHGGQGRYRDLPLRVCHNDPNALRGIKTLKVSKTFRVWPNVEDDGRRQTADGRYLALWALLWYSYGVPFRFEARCRTAQRSAVGGRRSCLSQPQRRHRPTVFEPLLLAYGLAKIA